LSRVILADGLHSLLIDISINFLNKVCPLLKAVKQDDNILLARLFVLVCVHLTIASSERVSYVNVITVCFTLTQSHVIIVNRI